MIQALILYYLNIKPTHGYEIQKFLQLVGVDDWAKIQSGSIYYALTKFEKSKDVDILREERTGARIRKIYAITDKGRITLKNCLKDELLKPIVPSGSSKFLINPLLACLEKKEVVQCLNNHINQLKISLDYWENWKSVKINEHSARLEELSFNMTIDSLKHQIVWHEELLENIDFYIDSGKQMESFVKQFDFSEIEEVKDMTEFTSNIDYLVDIKNEIANNPDLAIKKFDELIKTLSKK